MKPAERMAERAQFVLKERGAAAREIVERRTPTSKTFDLGNGLFHTSQRARPVHYFEDGNAREIDLVVSPALRVEHAPYKAEVLKDAIGYRYESRTAGWMQVELETLDGQKPRVPKPRIAENEVWWDDVAPGVSMFFRAQVTHPEIFKQYAAPHTTTWRVTQSPDFKGRFDDRTRGKDAAGDNLEIITTYEDGLFTEQVTGRVSRIKDRESRRKGWQDGIAWPALVDAAITENIEAGIDDVDSLASVYSTGTFTSLRTNANEVRMGVGGTAVSHSTQWGGFRFRALALPAGATVSAATLTFNVISFSTFSVKVYGDEVDDAALWAAGNRVKDITKTTASKTLEGAGTESGLIAYDVTDIVAEVAARAGWATGNDMRFGFFPQQDFPNARAFVVEAFDAAGTDEAQLDITYTEGAVVSTIALVSSPKTYTASSTDTLPTVDVPEGSLAYVGTTGTPNVVRRHYFVNGAWGREARDPTT